MIELSKRYDFKEIDDKWCSSWEKENLFHAQADPRKKPYTIVIPPPNVTGILHMGHALNNTLQDIIIRYKRMRGFATLWMPGTDHAGIATQNVVEKQLAKEGKKRQDIGRDAFLERLWAWKKEYGDTIIRQLKKLGSSCDWTRLRFTMDDDYSHAVKEVFVRLYDKGLIYRGEYIINWCPRCHTALSDEEAEHREMQGQLYYIRYPFKDDPNDGLTVATTRPETMLGDTAVAVNKKDRRYKNAIGKTLVLPLMDREIPVIGDELVDPKFGTGAVKVTPAHDPNDFTMGRRHHLAFINIMHPNAVLNGQAGDFEGMDRFEAREAVIEALKEAKCLVKVEPHTHAVGHCYRCHTVVEPYLSRQWFVKMEPLAKPAIQAVKKGKITFHPKRWTKVYMNWMENIRDWCISRQIWWGHRIPVWYCDDPQCAPIVTAQEPKKCPQCGSANLKQDEDVLDTWFSSWLWPFATLGWPKENPDLKYFYPTASLFTAPEIIFFWVARMIMAGMEFMGDIPFSDVYLHGTVRDAKGRKMSKSLGNALDPLEIIDEYGADALRFSLIINSGQDLFISKEKFEIGRNFANKIWNASRLILMNAPAVDPSFAIGSAAQIKGLDLPSRWIISKLHSTPKKSGLAIEQFRYSEAENLIYEFFWGNFCDWYLEIIKDRWSDATIQNVAFKVLEESLKMIHPFMPFVTEEIWSQCHPDAGSISRQAWPSERKPPVDKASETKMQKIIDLVTLLRNVRAQWNIKPQEKIDCHLSSASHEDLALLEENKHILAALVRIDHLTAGAKPLKKDNAVTVIAGNIRAVVPLGGLIDVNEEKKRMLGQIEEQKRAAANLAARLKNKDFLKKAPQDIVDKEKARLAALNTKITELEKVISSLTS
ncbi:MAG TPA: valine--tRNA ligase [Candidatus Omnitrophota bacterium]|nr:valine--tRNA ligase [Candidatus Omnitrophota bacterium]